MIPKEVRSLTRAYNKLSADERYGEKGQYYRFLMQKHYDEMHPPETKNLSRESFIVAAVFAALALLSYIVSII